ncbi:MAG: extracellular solute-binding protein, partial [Hyphomicrobiales bacterium]
MIGLTRNYRRMRKATVMVVGTLLATTVAACGAGITDNTARIVHGNWEEVVAAAEKEGSVTYYTNTAPEQSRPMIAAFEKKYPNIKVNFTRGAADLESKLDAEISAGLDGADVVVMTHRQWNIVHAPDFIEPTGLVPALDNWPADAWSVDGVAPNASVTPMGIIAWNTDRFPEGFADWNDLLTPAVKDNLAMRDHVDATLAGYLKFLAETNGPDYLTELAKQDPTFYSSVVPMAAAVASNEIGVAAMSVPATLVELKAKNAPVDWVIPPKTWAVSAPVTMLKKSERPNAARVFVDFMLSPEGQAAFNGKGYGASAVPNVPGT